MRPKNAFDGSARFCGAVQLDANCDGLHTRLRESAGVRAHAAPRRFNRRVALPIGEPRSSMLTTVTICWYCSCTVAMSTSASWRVYLLVVMQLAHNTLFTPLALLYKISMGTG